MIAFSCTGCATSFSVKDELAGKKTKCPKCGVSLLVPVASGAGPPPFVAIPGASVEATGFLDKPYHERQLIAIVPGGAAESQSDQPETETWWQWYKRLFFRGGI